MMPHNGYMQHPKVPSELANQGAHGLSVDMDEVTYYVGQRLPVATSRQGGMAA